MMATIDKKSKRSDEPGRCMWMQAGVVRHRYCSLDYNCPECRLDRVLRNVADENRALRAAGLKRPGRRGSIVCWRDKMTALPQTRQPCVHHMKGRIDFRSCTHAYRCGDCDFDQYFQDQFSVYADIRPVHVMEVEGIQVPQGYYLHPGHTWVKLEEGSVVRVGLDDFARRILGPPDRIEAPLVGQMVSQGNPAIQVHRGSLKTQLVSPLSGVVTDVNPALRSKGAAIHTAPYADGWVFRLHADSLREDLKALVIGSDTADFYDREVTRLYQEIEKSAGPLAADGGFIGDDISGNLPDIDWQRVMRLFFRS
ncbi:MAG: glycine cleavage system protein H [Pseudomonadota bacterium]